MKDTNFIKNAEAWCDLIKQVGVNCTINKLINTPFRHRPLFLASASTFAYYFSTTNSQQICLFQPVTFTIHHVQATKLQWQLYNFRQFCVLCDLAPPLHVVGIRELINKFIHTRIHTLPSERLYPYTKLKIN